MIIEKYCNKGLASRYISARTIIREKKLKRLEKSKKVQK